MPRRTDPFAATGRSRRNKRLHPKAAPREGTVEETTMIDDPKTDNATESEQAEEMEKAQEDAAKEREENGGYQ
jgi:hypothetical protein